MLHLARLFVVSLALVLVGCAFGQPMTPAEIQTHGTHHFDAPPEKVFNATVAALKVEGYQVALADEAKGLIKTDRKLVRRDARGGRGYASSVDVTRQYVVTVKAAANRTDVVAEPHVFQGEADLSSGEVWNLEGEAGERALWGRLFKEIQGSI